MEEAKPKLLFISQSGFFNKSNSPYNEEIHFTLTIYPPNSFEKLILLLFQYTFLTLHHEI